MGGNCNPENINRVIFKLSARERDPGKWAQKKIAFLAGTSRKKSLATSQDKRKSRTAKLAVERRCHFDPPRTGSNDAVFRAARTAGLCPGSGAANA